MNGKDKIDMTKSNLWKSMFVFSIPLMISYFLQVLFNISDIAVVGKFAGSDSLGAVGSTTILITLFTGLIIGISGGVNVLVARFIGAKDIYKLKKTIESSIVVCFVIGLIVMVFGILLTYPLLQLIKTKDELISKAIIYLSIYLVGIPGAALYNYGNAVFSALGNTKKPLLFLSIAGAINILLNLFFVIVCHMDVAGVALASTISQYLSAILILTSLSLRKDDCNLCWKEIVYDKESTIELLKIGVPSSLQYAIFAIANMFIQFAVNSFDVVIVDGNAAAANFDALVYDLMAAFYLAGASFIGQNYGAKNRERIKKAFMVSVVYSFSAGLLLGGTLYLFGHFFLSLFTNDEMVIQMGLRRLSIMGLSYCVSAFMDAPIAASRGLGKTIIPTIIEIIGSCVFRVIWVFTVFEYYHTIESLFILYVFSWTITAIAEIIYFFIIYHKLCDFRMDKEMKEVSL